MGSELGITPDSKPQADYSPVSIWWACWAAVWTFAVALGMAYLIVHRDMPTLRIRGLGLSLSAVVLLHLYWGCVQFGTMIGAIMPGDAQYWVMGIYLPWGISLFHASNSRFLHVAKHQKQYAHHDSRQLEAVPNAPAKGGGLINRFRRLEYTKKILVILGIVIPIQLFITILMWLISRKWHSSWGIPGTEVHGTPMEQATEMGRGWEWWPSVAGQLFWSWVVAPIVLWKSRHIHDTQGWRVQTIGCAIASLPATPMWLIGLYVDGMQKVNQYWIPPQWICLSIIFIEIFTVFLPCWEVMRSKTLRKETLDAIAQWEEKKASSPEGRSLGSISTMVDSMMSGWKSTNGSVETSTSNRESILTMGALEHVLARNPGPLQKFSALNDFSGENVAFLTSVAEWKSSFPKGCSDPTAAQDENCRTLIRERFNRALRIYARFISVRHAEFPVNISSQDLRKLESIFDQAASTLYTVEGEGEVDPATPFENPGSYPMKSPLSPAFPDSAKHPTTSSESLISDRVQYWGDVPEDFGPNVFDNAEESIKYLVLTNTWPKFVRNRRGSTDSSDTARNGDAV
ncbi:hypothetical protein BDV25DRAFT_169176 [Aspergillus avenaceus]|uniref:RGS domain-containing protein n=1 Tax=Aspergillus avenaceus TaxID=36643 RepID=A0A5N6U3U1_ASPAV|nr:hypothetical protein BDV25DRAFT_169176 [Aspergillus avenaceus]